MEDIKVYLSEDEYKALEKKAKEQEEIDGREYTVNSFFKECVFIPFLNRD